MKSYAESCNGITKSLKSVSVRSLTTLFIDSALQDEQRKLEDSEKRSREDLSERAESLFIEINEAMDRSENPESQKSNVEVDEL